ncbi:cadherin-like protein 26 [Sebastes fasciatus]|uniref:cadherin-like protein 26 n=1 Tax=Sebastes fasciatus TaxID=394691 RepID=UPI003D9DDBC7
MATIHLSLFLMLCLGVHSSSSEILKRHKRNWIIDSFSIDEGYEGAYPYILGKVEIEKNYTFFKIKGQGVNLDPIGVLKINEDTGIITVHKHVDHEKYKVLKLTFQALDRDHHAVDTQLGIDILIKDANDNAPKFTPEFYNIKIKESTTQGTIVTTLQANDEDSTGNNRLFDFKVVSVNPQPHEVEFYLTQKMDSEDTTRTTDILFKGCLDHERADKYTILVEAKDRGEKIQLSSICTVIIDIEDGNNHLPVITGQTGLGRVKEGEENVLVKRIQVTDKDTKGTTAWKAKYKIQGDANKNFMVKTDPETNEGLLYVEKHLDFESISQKNLTISVENEIAYHSCKVIKRTTDPWEVVTKYVAGTESLSTCQVTVIVEDVNDSPFFVPPNKKVMVVENVKAGYYLETFTARDPDITNTFVYRKGDDPADWVIVDTKTGKITTSKIIDRESSFVKDNIYKTTILAVDNGQPPLTGTATLEIHINDMNDHAPFLPESIIDMCQSEGPSLANITAVDLDENPYAGPFTFNLLGDVEDKWKLAPKKGYTVNLVKEPTVPSGQYELLLEVMDLQDMKATHNLSVTVCNCEDTARPNCRVRKATGSALGGGAIGILFLGMLLLAVLLLLAFLVSCKSKRKRIAIPDGDSGQHLMTSNIETPGTDCKVAFVSSINNGHSQKVLTVKQLPVTIIQTETPNKGSAFLNRLLSDSTMAESFGRVEYGRRSKGASSAKRTGNWELRSSMRGTWAGHGSYSAYQQNNVIQREVLLKVLKKKLHAHEAPGEELGDYAPHVYGEEGDAKTNFDLDAISMPDDFFDPDMDLDYKFNNLASVCMPSESTAFS